MKVFVTGVGGQLGHDVMNELHKRGNDEDEHKRMYVSEPERLKQKAIQQPCHGGGNRHDEHDRAGHAERSLRLLGNAKERATAQKAAQNEVVHEDRTDDYD